MVSHVRCAMFVLQLQGLKYPEYIFILQYVMGEVNQTIKSLEVGARGLESAISRTPFIRIYAHSVLQRRLCQHCTQFREKTDH